MNKKSFNKHQIQQLSDQCVKCGLCLPHCPTYNHYKNENESPRGRISLIQGLIAEKLAPTQQLQDHLNHCLGCRNCEPICPAKVEYGQIIDSAKTLLPNQPDNTEKLMRWASSNNKRLQKLATLSKWMPDFVMKALHPKQRIGLRVLQQVSSPTPYVNQGNDATLFSGCITCAAQGELVADTLNVLKLLGINANHPALQPCCGAIDQHHGWPVEATAQSEKLAAIFSGVSPNIISMATGCSAQWKEHIADHLPVDTKYYDLGEFLEAQLDRLPSANFSGKPLLHIPCSQKNVLKSPHSYKKCLEKVLGDSIPTTANISLCCGAAGALFVEQPELSRAIAEELISHVKSNEYSVIISPNVGCLMHLKLCLEDEGLEIPIIHPISFMAQILGEHHELS